MKQFFVCFVVLTLLSPSLAEEANLKDGAYEGAHGFIRVSITVTDGKISEIRILEHGGGGEKYKSLVEPLLDEIVENQSTKVDAVSGASVSSDYLTKAVDDAVGTATTETQQ